MFAKKKKRGLIRNLEIKEIHFKGKSNSLYYYRL